MATWQIPLLHWANATGGAIWAFDEGGGIVIAVGSGTLDGNFPAAAVGIYLDGSATPSDVNNLPAGFTPDDAYTFHWREACAGAGDSIAMSFSAIGDVLNHSGPDAAPLEIDSALTGCTLSVLQAIAASTVTATMTANDALVVVGDEVDPGPDPDTLIWFNGTYTLTPPVVTSITPSSGSVNGEQAVTIRGLGFTGAPSATLGGTALTSFVVVNDTTITGVTGAHASGAVDVVVTGIATLAGGYTYVIARIQLPPIPGRVSATQGGSKGQRRG